MPGHIRFSDLKIGDEIPPKAHIVTRGDVALYADASGDHNPLHQDDGFARDAGFDGVIAHGMFTMGHLAASLVDWLGDAGALLRMKVSFRAAVALGETIVIGGRVKALDPATKRATLEVWVSVSGSDGVEQPIKRSQAEVQLL
jgi:acyl dehydratase